MAQWWVILPPATNKPGAYAIDTGTKAQIEAKYPANSEVWGPFADRLHAVSAQKQIQANAWKGVAGWFTMASGGVPVTPGVAQTGVDWYKGLNLAGWLLRVGEIILGVVLIGVGIAKLSGADNVINKAAKVAGKVAVL